MDVDSKMGMSYEVAIHKHYTNLRPPFFGHYIIHMIGTD